MDDRLSDLKLQVAIVKQALAELSHCVSAGPGWFTKGESGRLQHAHMWTDKGMQAVAVLEKLNEIEPYPPVPPGHFEE